MVLEAEWKCNHFDAQIARFGFGNGSVWGCSSEKWSGAEIANLTVISVVTVNGGKFKVSETGPFWLLGMGSHAGQYTVSDKVQNITDLL